MCPLVSGSSGEMSSRLVYSLMAKSAGAISRRRHPYLSERLRLELAIPLLRDKIRVQNPAGSVYKSSKKQPSRSHQMVLRNNPNQGRLARAVEAGIWSQRFAAKS